MRAVLTIGHGGREMLEPVTDHPVPVAGPGDVVVRVAATALNYHDIFTRRGMPGITIPLPVIVGSDIAGTIDSIGDSVSGWTVGDRVLVDPVILGERPVMIGETMDGGRAELVRVPAGQLLAVPDGVDLDAAAALPLAYGTAHRMMMTRGKIAAGETVLVLGASGGVGAACVQLAKLAGAQVVACASSTAKLDRLAAIGADHLIDYSKTDIVSAVKAIFGKPRLSGEGGVDVAVNFTGGDTWEATQRCLSKGGRMLNCGATAGYSVTTDLRYLFSFEQQMIGSDGWHSEDLTSLLSMLADGRLAPLIDCRLPLEEAAEAERILEDREVVGKVLLKL